MNSASNIGPRLPLTHYDILKSREPWLFDFIQKDIDVIRRAGKEGPFGLDAEYVSKNIEAYAEHKVQMMKASMQQMLVENGFEPLSDAELNYALSQRPEFRNLAPSMIADYMGALNFELFDRKTIYLTGRLIDQLAHTALNATAELLKLPFPSCMFVLNYGDSSLNTLNYPPAPFFLAHASAVLIADLSMPQAFQPTHAPVGVGPRQVFE